MTRCSSAPSRCASLSIMTLKRKALEANPFMNPNPVCSAPANTWAAVSCTDHPAHREGEAHWSEFSPSSVSANDARSEWIIGHIWAATAEDLRPARGCLQRPQWSSDAGSDPIHPYDLRRHQPVGHCERGEVWSCPLQE